MDPLRIAHITYDWYPNDVLVRRVCEAAARRDIEVDVLCSGPPGAPRTATGSDGVHIYRLPTGRLIAPPLPLAVLHWGYYTLMAGLVVTLFHLRRRYDVIHIHNMPDFLVFAGLGPKLFGAKIILHVQDLSPELMASKAGRRKRKVLRALAGAQERLSTMFAHHVVTVGWPFERLLLQRGVKARNLTIILNSVDIRLFPASRRTTPRQASPSEDRPLIFMYHGTIAYRNRLDIAVRALAMALPQAPHIRLDLMGRGEEVPALKRLAQDLGVADRVVIRNGVSSEHVVDFVAPGDIGVIPYPTDGFMDLLLPTKAYEYAWLGKPMIASDTAAIRSMFRPGSVYLCPPCDPVAFAAAMVDLYIHPEKCIGLAERALEDYAPYRWELMADRYVELLGCLSGRAVASPEVTPAPPPA
jgi:glycosyltransferase involved in cell wall biosynthesis